MRNVKCYAHRTETPVEPKPLSFARRDEQADRSARNRQHRASGTQAHLAKERPSMRSSDCDEIGRGKKQSHPAASCGPVARPIFWKAKSVSFSSAQKFGCQSHIWRQPRQTCKSTLAPLGTWANHHSHKSASVQLESCSIELLRYCPPAPIHACAIGDSVQSKNTVD